MLRGCFLALLLVGCHDDVELLPSRDLGGSGADGGSTTVSTPAGPVCAASTAASLHRYALCDCAPLTTSRTLQTVVFDSTGAATSHTGAALGFNGDCSDTSALTLEGAVYSAGTLTLNGGGQIAETLGANGSLVAGGNTNVSGDAFVGGDVSGSAVIGGTLHVPAAATVAAGVQAGAIVRQPVSVADPCDCATAAAIDVAGAVTAAAAHNDNAAIGLPTGALTSSVALPDGRFYVAALTTDSDGGDVTLTVHGRAALYVGGDVTLKGALSVALDATAELDLFIGGALSTQSNRTFGSIAAPARVRIWSAASAIALDGRPVLGAVLTAPVAAVSAANGLELYGSLLAASFSTDNDALFHYDQAILSSGVGCGGTPLPPVH